MSFTNKGKQILEKLARDERMINYQDLILKAGIPIIGNYDFLKKYGTLNDLLLGSLSEEISTKKAAKEQNEMIRNRRANSKEVWKRKKLKVL